MNKLILGSLLSFYLTGCASAEIVKKIYEPKKAGVVRYKDDLIMGDKNRAEATQLMSSFCSGSYRIVKEERKSEFSGTTTSTTSDNGTVTANQDISKYLYLSFACKD